MVDRPVARASVAAAIVLSGAAIAQAAQQPVQTRPNWSQSDRECLARAMFFESNKSAEDGMLAVGTVVANRLGSGRYGSSMCGVVGQRGQFAAGVLSRRMTGEAADRARRIAGAVLNGHRHPAVKNALFFHTAGLRFSYGDMHYLTVAGGNIFYEKRPANSAAAARANAYSMARAYASAKTDQAAAAPVLTAMNSFALAAHSAPKAVAVAETQIRFGTAPLRADAFRTASAYSPTSLAPAQESALAAVAALGPKSTRKPGGPRVISAATPVHASMTPVFAAPRAPHPDPRANTLVAQAWAIFR